MTWSNHLVFLHFHSHCHTPSNRRSFVSSLNLIIHTLALTNCFCHISSSIQINVVWVYLYIFHLFLSNILWEIWFIFSSILPKLVVRLVIAWNLSFQIIICVIIVSTMIQNWCFIELSLPIVGIWCASTNRWWFWMISLRYRFWSILHFWFTHAIWNILVILLFLIVIELICIWHLF